MVNTILKYIDAKELEVRAEEVVPEKAPSLTKDRVQKAFQYLKWIGASYVPLEFSTDPEDHRPAPKVVEKDGIVEYIEQPIPKEVENYKNYAGKGYKEIAKAVGLTVGQVKQLHKEYVQAKAEVNKVDEQPA